MKRFYKEVSLSPLSPTGQQILLDGKPVRSPEKHLIAITSPKLADAVRSEWAGQLDTIDPTTMPLTQWVSTVMDRITPNRQQLAQEVLGYLDTDLICYRAPAEGDTEAMGLAHAKHWDAPHKWAESHFGIPIQTTTGLEALTQDARLHAIIQEQIAALSEAEFAVLVVVTHGTGSLLLAFAFLKGEFDPEQIFAAAFVEEKVKYGIYNEEFYGSAPDQERREKLVRGDLTSARLYLSLL